MSPFVLDLQYYKESGFDYNYCFLGDSEYSSIVLS